MHRLLGHVWSCGCLSNVPGSLRHYFYAQRMAVRRQYEHMQAPCRAQASSECRIIRGQSVLAYMQAVAGSVEPLDLLSLDMELNSDRDDTCHDEQSRWLDCLCTCSIRCLCGLTHDDPCSPHAGSKMPLIVPVELGSLKVASRAIDTQC